jgi:hypothetical protein
MRKRCLNPKDSKYKWYGAKGIRICDVWNDYIIFKAWAICHGWHKGLTIERIDPLGDYTPDNCEWISQSENSKRRNSR